MYLFFFYMKIWIFFFSETTLIISAMKQEIRRLRIIRSVATLPRRPPCQGLVEENY